MRTVLGSIAFFLSGFAALIYQVVWQRMLVLPIGADVYSTTVIVGAFMAGLGCGSLAGGHIADRLTRRRCLLMFVAAEAAVALFGLASRYIFYDWMYLGLGGMPLGPVAVAIVVFAGLIWPTFWMGMSLPLLARAVTSGVAGAPTRIGVLYGLNTLGAAAGAFSTTWLLFPARGLAGSLSIAVSLNALAAIAALILIAIKEPNDDEAVMARAPDEERTASEEPLRWAFPVWIVLYGLAGFQALSLEIIWFRLLGVMVKSSAFTFGMLLTVYLAGLGLGAALASIAVGRVRRPARAFLLLQAFVALYAGATILALTAWIDSAAILAPLWRYFGSYEPLDAAAAAASFWTGAGDPAARAQFIRLYLLLPAILIGPPTMAMGASFPLVQRITVLDVAHIGRRLGTVLLANIAGSTLGAILTGWVALTYFGSAGSLKIVTATGAIFLALAVASERSRLRRWTTPAAITAASLVILFTLQLPSGQRLWARLHGATSQRIVQAEDASGVSILKSEGAGAIVFVNGIGQSWIPFGNIHTVLGALPAFIHPAPREAAVIGLGSGDTVYAVAGRPELARITGIEIIRPQLATLQEWRRRTAYPGLVALLSDPRVEQVADDGRAYLMHAGRAFDIIEADALRPTSAYSGNLYSVGYFELVRSRLAPGGLAVTWAPTRRVFDTFMQVFPHALSFGDILVGSTSPIRFDAAEIKARLAAPAVQEYYFRAGINIGALLAPYLDAAPRVLRGATGPA
ncbi:MAG: spermidine synthase, partial [Acidobacteriota bacterium]|nr:spermidine synthase [Acidobacteriota bacterium]